MATKAQTSKFIQLQRGDGAGSETFTTIAEVTDITGPGEQAAQLDASSFDSDAMEFIAGLTDNGELTFTCNFIGSDAQQQGLRVDSRAGTTRNFKLNFPVNTRVGETTPTGVSFAAIVTKPPTPKAGVNAVIKADCSLKISGVATWVYGS